MVTSSWSDTATPRELTAGTLARERKRHKPEEIVAKLRQVETLTGQGTAMADAIRQIGVTEVT